MAIPYEQKLLPAASIMDFNVSQWAGVNKIKGSQADYEMADCKNMCADNFPYASPRKSREKVVDESGIQRIYKVEGDKVYYIDAEGYLCYAEKGEKNQITDEKLDFVKCTNNYDNLTVFYPEMSYLDEENKLVTFEPKLIFGEVPEEPTKTKLKNQATSGGYLYSYRLSVFSQVLPIEILDTREILVEMKLPFASEYGYHTDIEPSIAVMVYDESGENKFGVNKLATIDGRTNNYTFSLKDNQSFEKGDYIIFELYCNSSDEVSSSLVGTWKRLLNYALTATWTITNDPVFSTLPLDYAVVYNNRVVGVKGSDIRASSLGDFTNFWSYVDEAGNPDAVGAYATDVGSSGEFTGICAYNNVLLLFKKDIVYEMYGSMPYTITELCTTGCIDNDSIASVDGVLYWASPKGIVRYSGGVPVVISTQIDIDTSGICKAGTDGRKYYAYDGKKVFVYDTYYQLWHIEDDKNVNMFYNHINDLYAVYDDGIYKIDSGSEAVEWEFETKDYTFGSKERKNLSKLWLRADMPKNSRLEVYVKQNGGEWQRVAVKTAEKDEMFDFKLRVKKCDSFALKFKGKGDVRILDIHGKITVGTSKHRSGASLNVYRK
ncbi:MAG: hypothetical protein IKV86_03245 [Clostridia bacterium]|nr:hypothetical protein [Clostridia bacterium]